MATNLPLVVSEKSRGKMHVSVSFAKSLQSIGQGVMKTLQEAKIGETLESGMNTVRAKLSDPNLQKEVKEKAQASWNWLSEAAGSLWSVAKDAAAQLSSEFADDNHKPSTPRPTPNEVRKPSSPRPMGVSAPVQTSVPSRPTDSNSDVEDEDWMERELEQAR